MQARPRGPLAPWILMALALLLVASAQPAAATDTDIEVRVLSKGAKFIGSSMGGARVTVHDSVTGELLADGVTTGSTGDTGRIMRSEHGRPAVLSTPDAAAYTVTLDLERPRRLRFTAFGPLAQRQAANEASVTQWVAPGQHLTGGDGVLLEIPGFAVDVLAPPSHSRPGPAPTDVEVRANVTMMCGCPLTPGGLWDADAFEVVATVRFGGETVAELPLAYAGSASQFAATFRAEEPGLYEITVVAHDPENANTGVDFTTVIVRGGA